mgnify:CR=1 FL=1
MENARESKSPLDIGYYKQVGKELPNNDQYRKLIGMLLYVSTNTRPDIAASVAILSKKVEKPRDNDFNELKRIIRYLKGTRNLKLKLSVSNQISDVIAFSDANWAEDKTDRKSNSGFCIFLNGGLISWCCRKQDIIALSSAESEFVAITETCKELMWIKSVIQELNVSQKTPITVMTDSQSCIALIENQKFSNRSKHIDTKYHFFRDHVVNKKISLKYVSSGENVADLMTKPLGPLKLKYHRSNIGLME